MILSNEKIATGEEYCDINYVYDFRGISRENILIRLKTKLKKPQKLASNIGRWYNPSMKFHIGSGFTYVEHLTPEIIDKLKKLRSDDAELLKKRLPVCWGEVIPILTMPFIPLFRMEGHVLGMSDFNWNDPLLAAVIPETNEVVVFPAGRVTASKKRVFGEMLPEVHLVVIPHTGVPSQIPITGIVDLKQRVATEIPTVVDFTKPGVEAKYMDYVILKPDEFVRHFKTTTNHAMFSFAMEMGLRAKIREIATAVYQKHVTGTPSKTTAVSTPGKEGNRFYDNFQPNLKKDDS